MRTLRMVIGLALGPVHDETREMTTTLPSAAAAPIASELPSHAYAIDKPVRGSDIPMQLCFVLARDEIYLPMALRKPKGDGPFPVIVMGSGNGRGGMPHVERQVERLASMQDELLQRGYAVVYVNYRNEIPYLYGQAERAHNLADDVSGEGRTLKSSSTLDFDDLTAAFVYLRTAP